MFVTNGVGRKGLFIISFYLNVYYIIYFILSQFYYFYFISILICFCLRIKTTFVFPEPGHLIDRITFIADAGF